MTTLNSGDSKSGPKAGAKAKPKAGAYRGVHRHEPRRSASNLRRRALSLSERRSQDVTGCLAGRVDEVTVGEGEGRGGKKHAVRRRTSDSTASPPSFDRSKWTSRLAPAEFTRSASLLRFTDQARFARAPPRLRRGSLTNQPLVHIAGSPSPRPCKGGGWLAPVSQL